VGCGFPSHLLSPLPSEPSLSCWQGKSCIQVPSAPSRVFLAPYTTVPTRLMRTAPAHIAQGSKVTYNVAFCRSHLPRPWAAAYNAELAGISCVFSPLRQEQRRMTGKSASKSHHRPAECFWLRGLLCPPGDEDCSSTHGAGLQCAIHCDLSKAHLPRPWAAACNAQLADLLQTICRA